MLPWVSVSVVFYSASRSGLQDGRDGLWSAALGLLAVVIGIARLTDWSMPWWLTRSPLLLATGVGLIAFANFSDISERVDQLSVGEASIGSGIYVLFGAAAVMGVAGILLLSTTHTTTFGQWARGHGEAVPPQSADLGPDESPVP